MASFLPATCASDSDVTEYLSVCISFVLNGGQILDSSAFSASGLFYIAHDEVSVGMTLVSQALSAGVVSKM